MPYKVPLNKRAGMIQPLTWSTVCLRDFKTHSHQEQVSCKEFASMIARHVQMA